MHVLASCHSAAFIISLVHLVEAGAAITSSKTTYPNATITPFIGVGTTASGDCPTNCTRWISNYYSLNWSPLPVTATITAETILYVVNKRNNNTRTETITNTEVDLKDFKKPNNTNSAGTQVATIGVWDGSTTVNRELAYPTTYTGYDPHYSLNGVLSTTISGHPTCMRANGGLVDAYPTLFSTFTFPSHPSVPPTITAHTTDTLDPRGWTYSAIVDYDGICYYEKDLEPLFPDLGMWKCTQMQSCAAPAVYHATALYLTGTSTSTEGGEEPTITSSSDASGTGLFTVQRIASAAERPPESSMPAPTATALAVPAQPSVNSDGNIANSPVGVSANGENSSPQVHQGTPMNPISAAPQRSGNPTSFAPAARPAPIVVNSETVSANSASQYLISSQTVQPGGSPITLGSGPSAQIVAIQTSNSLPLLVIDSSTSTLPVPAPTPLPAAPGPIVVGSQTITANAASQYILSSQTLAVGSPVTLGSGSSAQVVAVQTSNSETFLVEGGSTSQILGPLPTTTTSSMGIGGFVASGLGGTGVSTPLAFTGDGNSLTRGGQQWRWRWLVGCYVLGAVVWAGLGVDFLV